MRQEKRDVAARYAYRVREGKDLKVVCARRAYGRPGGRLQHAAGPAHAAPAHGRGPSAPRSQKPGVSTNKTDWRRRLEDHRARTLQQLPARP